MVKTKEKSNSPPSTKRRAVALGSSVTYRRYRNYEYMRTQRSFDYDNSHEPACESKAYGATHHEDG